MQEDNNNSNNNNNSNSNNNIIIPGISNLLNILYTNHSDITRDIIFKIWYRSWDSVESELLLLYEQKNDNLDQIKNISNQCKDIYQRQWYKIRALLYSCGKIEQSSFFDFLNITFNRFLKLVPLEQSNSSIFKIVLDYFLFYSNETEETLFRIFLEFISTECNKNENLNKLIENWFIDSFSKLVRAELPTRNSRSYTSAKFGIQLFINALNESENLDINSMLYSILIKDNSLVCLFQIVEISPLVDCQAAALHLIYLISEQYLDDNEYKKILNNFWSLPRISILFNHMIHPNPTLSQHALSCLHQIMKHLIDRNLIQQQFTPMLCYLLSQQSTTENSRRLVMFIEHIINSESSPEYQLRLIQSVLSCCRRYLYTVPIDMEANSILSPNSKILSLILSTHITFAELSKSNHFKDSTLWKETETQFYELIEDSLSSNGHSDPVFFTQLQLLYSFCCVHSKANKSHDTLLQAHLTVIEQVCI